MEIASRNDESPVWLSTSGLGVYWCVCIIWYRLCAGRDRVLTRRFTICRRRHDMPKQMVDEGGWASIATIPLTVRCLSGKFLGEPLVLTCNNNRKSEGTHLVSLSGYACSGISLSGYACSGIIICTNSMSRGRSKFVTNRAQRRAGSTGGPSFIYVLTWITHAHTCRRAPPDAGQSVCDGYIARTPDSHSS